MKNLPGWAMLIGCTASLLWAAVTVAFDRKHPRRRWVVITALGLLWGVTGVVLAVRFIQGLGPTTHMTDLFPWGVWIGFIQSGVALSGGGFVMAATVHVFHIRRFEPIVRPAVLTAFLGYCFVGASLFIEVGRPYRLWHPLAMWQHHSIMFEVAWCVTLYMSVLALEFSPVVLEKFQLDFLRRKLELVTIPLVIAGVLLSSLHQSSLGSMFLLMPQKVHPLWYSPLLPVMFLISSVAVGMCVIVMESFFASKLFHHQLPRDLMEDLGRSASWILILFLFVRVVDLTARGAWSSALTVSLQSAMFWVEFVAGYVIPTVVLSQPAYRARMRWLLGAASLVMGGTILNRLNLSWIGMLPYAGPVYTPSWMEFAVTATLITGVIVVFALAVRWLPVFPSENHDPDHDLQRQPL